MSNPNQSKRFNPNTLTEKIVPILLGTLVVILLAVFIIIGLSLMGLSVVKTAVSSLGMACSMR